MYTKLARQSNNKLPKLLFYIAKMNVIKTPNWARKKKNPGDLKTDSNFHSICVVCAYTSKDNTIQARPARMYAF